MEMIDFVAHDAKRSFLDPSNTWLLNVEYLTRKNNARRFRPKIKSR